MNPTVIVVNFFLSCVVCLSRYIEQFHIVIFLQIVFRCCAIPFVFCSLNFNWEKINHDSLKIQTEQSAMTPKI